MKEATQLPTKGNKKWQDGRPRLREGRHSMQQRDRRGKRLKQEEAQQR